MDRRSALAAGLGLCALWAAPIAARADDLQPLHVRNFSLSVDRNQIRVGEPFHLRIDLQVDETVPQCNGVMLPDFYGFESLGDERRTYTRSAGTACTEIITLSPLVPGLRIIAPASLDAIDANASRPMRFTTNTVTMHVLDAPLQSGTILKNTIVEMLKAIIIIILMTVVGLGVYWAFYRTLPGFALVRRIAPHEKPPPNETVEHEEPPDDGARWSAVAAALSAKPTRQSVVAVRSILRDQVRARDDEVFGELLARVAATTDTALLDVLRSIERAAFIDDENLPSAIRDAVRALERLADKPQMLSP